MRAHGSGSPAPATGTTNLTDAHGRAVTVERTAGGVSVTLDGENVGLALPAGVSDAHVLRAVEGMLTGAVAQPVPDAVPAWKGKIALSRAGLLASAEAAAQAAGTEAALAFEHADTWHRHAGLLSNLGTALGLTSEQIDDLFRQAEQVQV